MIAIDCNYANVDDMEIEFTLECIDSPIVDLLLYRMRVLYWRIECGSAVISYHRKIVSFDNDGFLIRDLE